MKHSALVLLLFGIFLGRSYAADWDVATEYAQSSDFWAMVSEIKAAEGNLPAINSILNRKYGTYEEALSRVIVQTRYAGWTLGMQAEGVGTGNVQNPVVPELHANTIIAGILKVNTELALADLPIRLGAFGGYGVEKKIDAVSTDLIDGLPIRNGALGVAGLEQATKLETRLASNWVFGASGELRETLFWSSTPPSALDTDSGRSFLAFRWRTMATLSRDWISAHFIAGPQPLPAQLLPISWDYAHRLDPFPELGVMAGMGLKARADLFKKGELSAYAGFYGGYVGAGASLVYRALSLELASVGIEESSAYQTLGQRIWFGSLGLHF